MLLFLWHGARLDETVEVYFFLLGHDATMNEDGRVAWSHEERNLGWNIERGGVMCLLSTLSR